MEGYCPPHYQDMRAAVDALCERKFGPGGPFHPDTPGVWKDSRKVRSAAQVHDERFRECVAHQAQYLYDTFGKFPGTVPSMFLIMSLQAHHLDLDFYDTFYKPGAYLRTHAMHMAHWHPDRATSCRALRGSPSARGRGHLSMARMVWLKAPMTKLSRQ
jgi:hypothetical protein